MVGQVARKSVEFGTGRRADKANQSPTFDLFLDPKRSAKRIIWYTTSRQTAVPKVSCLQGYKRHHTPHPPIPELGTGVLIHDVTS